MKSGLIAGMILGLSGLTFGQAIVPQELIVVAVADPTASKEDVAMLHDAHVDLALRAWFKWCDAVDYSKNKWVVDACHQQGILFGGGVTCSAIFDKENGLSSEQVLDMATRDTRGKIIVSPGDPRFRHGSLSNPKYVDYVLSWCRKQMDSGIDDLFMDEVDAALNVKEGFDDYSNAAFRDFLFSKFPIGDPFWVAGGKIDLTNRNIAPDGSARSFDYRGFLQVNDLADTPQSDANPLRAEWLRFRITRDAKVWREMIQSLREYADRKQHRVWIHGNRLAEQVDLQVLGIWKHWLVKGGRPDFAPNQLREWAAIVRTGREMAGKNVPVVLFHDWGDGFPWMTVSATQRTLWNRIRGAEIYAAGGIYAFPLHGMSGPSARTDGTLASIIEQSKFFHRNENLYHNAVLRSVTEARSDDPLISASVWTSDTPARLMVHVINRHVNGETLKDLENLSITIPCSALPTTARAVSPDWSSEQPVVVALAGENLKITFPQLSAYAVAVLTFDHLPELTLHGEDNAQTDQWGNIIAGKDK